MRGRAFRLPSLTDSVTNQNLKEITVDSGGFGVFGQFEFPVDQIKCTEKMGKCN